MRLINPGAGEFADRLTILELKLLFGEQAGKDTKHFRDERNAILTKVDVKGWLEPLVGLAAVNAALWHAEDDLRGYREDARNPILSKEALWEDAAKLAFRIQELNDRRAVLIEEINRRAGELQGPEKLSAPEIADRLREKP